MLVSNFMPLGNFYTVENYKILPYIKITKSNFSIDLPISTESNPHPQLKSTYIIKHNGLDDDGIYWNDTLGFQNGVPIGKFCTGRISRENNEIVQFLRGDNNSFSLYFLESNFGKILNIGIRETTLDSTPSIELNNLSDLFEIELNSYQNSNTASNLSKRTLTINRLKDNIKTNENTIDYFLDEYKEFSEVDDYQVLNYHHQWSFYPQEYKQYETSPDGNYSPDKYNIINKFNLFSSKFLYAAPETSEGSTDLVTLYNYWNVNFYNFKLYKKEDDKEILLYDFKPVLNNKTKKLGFLNTVDNSFVEVQGSSIDYKIV